MNMLKKFLILIFIVCNYNTHCMDGEPAKPGMLNPTVLISNEILNFNIDFAKLQASAMEAFEYVKGLPAKLQTSALAYWYAYKNKPVGTASEWATSFDSFDNARAQIAQIPEAQAVVNPAASNSGIFNSLKSGFNTGFNLVKNNKGRIALAISAYLVYKKVSDYLKKKAQKKSAQTVNLQFNFQGSKVDADRLTQVVQDAASTVLQ